MKIFLSHSTGDLRLAEAAAELLAGTVGRENVQIIFSSDERQGGGIEPGQQWFQWVIGHIRDAQKIYVLVTPTSLNRPWLMWESGFATGVGVSDQRQDAVVPVIFGVTERDIPSPLQAIQFVRGDTRSGVRRLLEDLNAHLGRRRIPPEPFRTGLERAVPAFLEQVRGVLAEAPPQRPLLAPIPSAFPAETIAGTWATSFTFGKRVHAEIVNVVAVSDRRVRIINEAPLCRTEGHDPPFCNVIEAEVVSRHLVGSWKNVSDARYFGSIHLAILTGEKVMQGRYTSFASELQVGTGPWKWVRLEPTSLDGVDWSRIKLRDPRGIHSRLDQHQNSRRGLPLTDIVEAP